jgi:hypothetical protein
VEKVPEDIKEEIEAWKTADQIKTAQATGSIINELWRQVGSVTVRCPSCSKTMEVQTLKNKKCIFCNKTFQIIPKNSKSNIVYCKRPDIMRNIHSLETRGVFDSIW